MPLKNIEKDKNYLNAKEIKVLELISARLEYEDHFFKTKSDLKWFWPLNLEGYFDFKRAPSPQPAQQEGYYTTPQWNILEYLVKVSKQLKGLPEKARNKYEEALLTLIRDTTQARRTILENEPHSLKYDNYRTWYFFAQILQNITLDKIDTDVIACFEVWMVSTFDTVLPGSEIGKRLLPLFTNTKDFPKSEQIARALLGYRLIDPPPGTTLFDGERKIVSRLEKYWLSDIFLKRKAAYELGKCCSQEFIQWLAGELRQMITVRHAKRFDFESIDSKRYSLILRMNDLNSFSGFLLSERKPLAPSEETIFKKDSLQTIAEKTEAAICTDYPAFEAYIESIIKKHLGQDFKIEKNTVNEFYKSIFADHSSIWIESLYDNYKSGYEDSLAVYVYILKDLLAGKAEAQPEMASVVLQELWGEKYKYPIFKRLVLYCMGKYYSKYREALFQNYFMQGDHSILDEYYFKPETYKLLELNASTFTDKELAYIETIISKGPKGYGKEPYTELQITYWAQEWYTALKSLPKYAALSEKLKSETKCEVNIPRRVVTWSGPGKSPLSKDDLQTKSNKEISEYISQFVSQRRDFTLRITAEGLAESLVIAVKEKPEKFASDLEPFLLLPYRFVYAIFDGFLEAHKTGKATLDWERILDFITAYVGQEVFWGDKLSTGNSEVDRATHGWVVGKVSELIRRVTSTDEAAISAEFNPRMQNILSVFVKHFSKEYVDENKDPVFHYLNSPEGKTIEALLNLSLRCARLNQKENLAPIWNAELKAMYEGLLADKIYDAYTILGRALANFLYLDEGWVVEKIKGYEKLEDKAWAAFMTGYLSSEHVYERLFALMNSHYRRAIPFEFEESRVKESLSQHIAVGYLRAYDDLDVDGLLCKFLQTAKPVDIERLIGFMWMQREREDETNLGDTPEIIERKNQWLQTITPRIIKLWRHIYESYQSNNAWDKKYAIVNSELAKLAVFLKEIDEENFKWMSYSASYLSSDVDASFFIEYLTHLKDKGDIKNNPELLTNNAKRIGAIWEQMLEGFTPDYKLENVQAILQFIKKHDKELAAKLFEAYVQRGCGELVRNL